jgi:hypothetical protein
MAESSGRADNLFPAGPNAPPALFFCQLLQTFVWSKEEPPMRGQGQRTEAADRGETDERSYFGYTVNGADGSSTVYDPGYCGAR